PQKAMRVGQKVQDAFVKNVALFCALRLEDLEDQILLAQTAGPGQIQRSGDLGQLGYVLFFEFCDGHRFTCEEISVGAMRKRSTYFRGRAGGPVMQPAVVPQQNVPARQEQTAAPSLQSGPALRSWFPGF